MQSPLRRRGLLRLTYAAPSAERLVLGLLVVIALGTLALLLPGMAVSGRVRFDQALFMATSGATVSGLSVINVANDLTRRGQFVLLALMEAGGVGFMMMAVFVLLTLRQRVSLANRLALQDSLGLLQPRRIVQVAVRTALGVLVMQGIGAALLWRHWTPLLGSSRALWFGLFHSVSAFCNVGFDLFSGAVGFNGIPTDHLTLVVLGALIIAGGLGIPVWSDLLFMRGRWSLHTRVTLVASAGLILLGFTGLMLAESSRFGIWAHAPSLDEADRALFLAISTRTAGFSPGIDMGQLSQASKWLVTVLMFIGTAPASMGGGITTGTLVILVLAMWSYLRGYTQVRAGRRSIAPEAIRRALAVLTMAVLLVGVATWLLLLSQGILLEDALFTVVSAFATVGFNTLPLDSFNQFSQLVIMGVMFWGRLGALTVVLALARRTPPQPIHYPEESLLLG